MKTKYYLDSQWKRITWYTQHKTENQSIAKRIPVQNLKNKDLKFLFFRANLEKKYMNYFKDSNMYLAQNT